MIQSSNRRTLLVALVVVSVGGLLLSNWVDMLVIGGYIVLSVGI